MKIQEDDLVVVEFLVSNSAVCSQNLSQHYDLILERLGFAVQQEI